MSLENFQIQNGNSLSILTYSCETYRLRISYESCHDDHVVIEDDYGHQEEIHESLIRDNHLKMVHGAIEVEKSLFFHWMKLNDRSSQDIEERDQEMMDLVTNFNLILAHKDDVYSRAEHFLCQPITSSASSSAALNKSPSTTLSIKPILSA